jgi:hypothetical protein
MKSKLHRWSNLTGLDFHVKATLFFRVWGIIAGGITVILLPLYLSPTEQGYYFTFASVLALQIFFELGLNQIIMQLVSHQFAHLNETSDGYLQGGELYLGKLGSLVRLIQRWFGFAALLFALIVGSIGAIFFGQESSLPLSTWLGAWILLVGFTAVNLWISPTFAVYEGCGKVGQVARLRLVQSVLGYASLWLLLLSGLGLWSIVAVPSVCAICSLYWLWTRGHLVQWLARLPADVKNRICWRRDVFPLQWRIALSWASGYLIFNLFTPVVFMHQGAIQAGKLGLALTIFGAISTVGMSWVNAKAPNFTMLIARGEWNALNILFKSVFLRSTLFIASASIIVVSILGFLDKFGISQVDRIASPSILAVLSIITINNSIIYALAVYMRAHREEPMLIQSIMTGLLVVCAIYIGSKYSILIMMILYLMICVFISLPWAVMLYIRYLKRSKN